MPLTRDKKEQLVESYREGLGKAGTVILVSYKGVTVPQVTELRSRVRETGGNYTVVKNSLVLRAIQGGGLAGLENHFDGPVAVAYGDTDPVALAKVLTDFAKDVPAIELKAGLVDGQRVGSDELDEIAKLPSRDELIAKLLYLLQSPITNFVRSLAALPQQLVAVLSQVAARKGQ